MQTSTHAHMLMCKYECTLAVWLHVCDVFECGPGVSYDDVGYGRYGICKYATCVMYVIYVLTCWFDWLLMVDTRKT